MSISKILGININKGAAPSGYPLDGITAFGHELSSVRLRTAYTGYAYIVRRSSDNATTSVSFDSNGKVTTSSNVSAGGNLGTWMGSDSLFIDTWYDQSGNGWNMVQATTTNQLQLASSGTLFTEPRTVPNTPSYVGATTNILNTSSPHSVWIVAATNCTSGGVGRANMYGVHDGFTGNRGAFGIKLADGVGSDWYLGARQRNSIRLVRGDTVLSGNTFYTHYHNYTGTAFEMRLNDSVESEIIDTIAPLDPANNGSSYFGTLYSYAEDGQKLRLLLTVQSDRSSDRSTIYSAIGGISWT